MTDKQKLAKAEKLIRTLKQDAKLALSGAWDKSDSGFEDQITLIDRFFDEIKNEKKGPLEQLKLKI